MAGYKGFSMSNNAVAAYEEGRKPLSRWTKTVILGRIEEVYGAEAYEKAKKHTHEYLRQRFLVCSEWHHTGKIYRVTEFWAFRDGLSEKRLAEILDFREKREKKPKKEPRSWRPATACWKDWSNEGRKKISRNRNGFGRTDSTVFECTDGTRKRVSGSWFRMKILDDAGGREKFMKAYGVENDAMYDIWLATGTM